jgi:ABC-type lipoprotein export system ATPase subunit
LDYDIIFSTKESYFLLPPQKGNSIMLEVKNLSKIYKSTVKNGVDTKALDNISLTFPEKGMVFLLGKSGSGKSTLLNVCGGLDAPTSGEIIVKGKSSKSFSLQDIPII